MIVSFYYTQTTDLVRRNLKPLIDYKGKELCTDFDDFCLSIKLRYLGILRDYPTAKLKPISNGAEVWVNGKMVYRCVVTSVGKPFYIKDEEE